MPEITMHVTFVPSSVFAPVQSTVLCQYSEEGITRRKALIALATNASSLILPQRSSAQSNETSQCVCPCNCTRCNAGFALEMEKSMERYEEVVASRKRRLLSEMPNNGVILDVGAGTGPNLAYLPPKARVIALEPNRAMWSYCLAKASMQGIKVDIMGAVAEKMPLPDASIDGAVCTLTLCSVSDPRAVLTEVARVLKPNAPFVYIEHVLAPESQRIRRAAQRLLNPAQRALADGCNISRDTNGLIRSFVADTGKMQVDFMDSFDLDLGLPLLDTLSLVRPHVCGVLKRTGVV